MDFVANHLLTLVLFSPVLAAFVILLLPRDKENLIRWVSMILSFVPLVFTVVLWFRFKFL